MFSPWWGYILRLNMYATNVPITGRCQVLDYYFLDMR